MNKQDIIKTLNLQEHIEGGYFARTYCSQDIVQTNRVPPERATMTSIYYVLTDDKPIGYFHLNRSDIMHYFHLGSPVTYLIIHPNGQLEEVTMGPDLAKNQKLQLLVKGGCWEASVLKAGEFSLISEAVSPGFDYRDMTLGTKEVLKGAFPSLWDRISLYVKSME